MLEVVAMKDINDVIIATVAPRALHNLEVLAKKYFKVEPLIAGESSAPSRLTLDVEEPGTVGADRVGNAIAAHHLYTGHLINDRQSVVEGKGVSVRVNLGGGRVMNKKIQ